MRSLCVMCWILLACILPVGHEMMAQNLQVLVLDALDGKPQANVKVEPLCAGLPRNFPGKAAFTNDKGLATISYVCSEKQVIEIAVFPPNKKEQCSADAAMNLKDVLSKGFVSNLTPRVGSGALRK